MAAKKNQRRRPKGTSQTARSMATGKRPSRGLKARRRRNTERGYYPNPAKKFTGYHVVMVKHGERIPSLYWGALGWEKRKAAAIIVPAEGSAKKLAQAVAELLSPSEANRFSVGYKPVFQ